jgi:hypothetical protein
MTLPDKRAMAPVRQYVTLRGGAILGVLEKGGLASGETHESGDGG